MQVNGVGPVPCEWCIVGEGPGYYEDACGRPFVGSTGDELDRLLEVNRLPSRDDIYLTNIYRFYQGKDYKYTAEDLERDEPFLLAELKHVKPRVIVTLGRHATRYFLGDVSMDGVQGLPWSAKICLCGRTQYHKDFGQRLGKLKQAAGYGPAQGLGDTGSSGSMGVCNKHIALHTSYVDKKSRKGSSLTTCAETEAALIRPTFNLSRRKRMSDAGMPLDTSVSMGTRSIERIPTCAQTQQDQDESARYASSDEARNGQGCVCGAGTPWHDIVIFPVVHPAAGMHNPEMSPYVVAGFQALAEFYIGNLPPRALYDDPLKGKETYEEITSAFQLDASLCQLKKGGRLAIDTEGWPWKPWSLQYSIAPGTGFVIRASASGLLKRRFCSLASKAGARLVLHSSLHDATMFAPLQFERLDLDIDDTMLMAYLLQIESQGLKDGALRHCNMQMQEYTDLMGDKANELTRDYLTWIYDAEQLEYEQRQQEEFDRRRAAGRRIRVLPKLPKSPLHKACVRVMLSLRSHDLWEDQVEDIRVAAYNRLGEVPQATLDYIEPEKAIYYSCRDADATLRLCDVYNDKIDAMGLRDVYNLELGTYPFIARMQQVGLKPDLEHFAQLSEKLQVEIDRLQAELIAATGRSDFNANSGNHVAEYLFHFLGLPEIKMTRGGRGSTNDKILEALEHEHPEHESISTIRTYREIYKLKNTFVDRLPDFATRWPYDGRVHTTFRTTRVVTGRLAASEPNVLAQPEHGQFAKEFKRGWVAEPGHVLCQWDESQIELRGLAHLSQDPLMLAIFRGEKRQPDGSLVDLHAATAERIFGVKPKDQDKSKHRLPAKAINFGIPMGMTRHGLTVELRKNGVDADEDTAQRWLDETLGLYAGVRRYMEQRKAEVARNGFVRCLSGRIRYIGGIHSKNDRVREEAERFAFSTPIQESATWIMKQSEASIYDDILVPLWRQGVWVEPILQVHDCIKIECEEGLERDLHLMVSEAMTNVPKGFSVPLAVEGEFGYNMADMEKFNR